MTWTVCGCFFSKVSRKRLLLLLLRELILLRKKAFLKKERETKPGCVLVRILSTYVHKCCEEKAEGELETGYEWTPRRPQRPLLIEYLGKIRKKSFCSSFDVCFFSILRAN